MYEKAIWSIPESIIILLLYYSVKGTPPKLSPRFLVISESIIMSNKMFTVSAKLNPESCMS